MIPPRAPTLFIGRTTNQLQTDLAAAQQAYIDLTTGARGEEYSYTQGDGARSVRYTRANLATLAALITTLQQSLGLSEADGSPIRRRPIRPVYR